MIPGLAITIGGVIKQLAHAYEAKAIAATDAERIAAEQRIEALRARRDVLVSGGWIPAAIQAAFAVPFIIYLWKLIVWDKVLGLGATDGLGEYETDIGQAVIAFYFLTAGAARVATIIRR